MHGRMSRVSCSGTPLTPLERYALLSLFSMRFVDSLWILFQTDTLSLFLPHESVLVSLSERATTTTTGCREAMSGRSFGPVFSVP